MGQVFVNYRSIDHPLGAAAIGAWLGLRFGEKNVFRDCASLNAGAHYPTSIRAALQNAAVLIAVIGPRWLTLTDDAGIRLIDRDEDWVRQELAYAFKAGIPVFPVLLKNTPADATMPKVAELPMDIQPLATIQAFEISQRRLGADLERLVTAISQVRTMTVTGPALVDVFFAMVDALEKVPSMRTEHDRAVLINLLPASIASSVAYSARRRTHAINLLATCRDYPDGVTRLLGVIQRLDGDDCVPLRRLTELAPFLPSSD